MTLEKYLQQRYKSGYIGISPRFCKAVIDMDSAVSQLEDIINSAVQVAGADADPNGTIPVEKIEVAAMDRNEVTKWKFTYKDGITDFYGYARQLCDLIDWDNVITTVEADFDNAIDGENAWACDDINVDDNTRRWLDLYDKGENIGRNDHTMQMGLQFPLDDVINKTFLKMGWKWRGWSKTNNVTPTTDAADFINWAMAEGLDFDAHMKNIGMCVDQSGDVRPELDIDIFSDKETTKQHNTTTMEPIKEAAAPQTAALIDGSEIATKYQKNFATFMANTNIKAAQRTWTMDGNKAVLTAVEEVRDGYSRISVMSYDTKWKGTSQRTTETECNVETVLHWRTPSMYQRAIDCNFDMAEMGKLLTEADCKKFGIEYIPTPKDEQSVNKGKQTKAVTPTHDSKTAPKKVEQTNPEVATETEVPSIQSRVTRYYRDKRDGRKYAVTPDGNGFCTVETTSASGDDRRTYELEMQKVNAIFAKTGCVEISADEFGGIKTEEPEPETNDAEIAAASRDIAAHAKEVAEEVVKNETPKAKVEQSEPTPAPEPIEKTPTILLNLPDTILTSEVENGRMTISGLNDLTAEQVNIFIAGMNAMREAIRKQMKMAE